MSIPLSWVDKIFTKLTLVYGHEFLNRWRDLDIDAVKADWAHELRGFKDQPHAIAYALENLQFSKAPNVFEFREIARRAPPAGYKSLPRKFTEDELEVNRKRIKDLVQSLKTGKVMA